MDKMKKIIKFAQDGTEITMFVPETDEDAKELSEMAKRGEVDDKVAFSDYPKKVRDRLMGPRMGGE